MSQCPHCGGSFRADPIDVKTIKERAWNDAVAECVTVAERYWAREVASQIRALAIPPAYRETGDQRS